MAYVLTMEQAAQMVGLSKWTIQRRCEDKRLKCADWGKGKRHIWRTWPEALQDILPPDVTLPSVPPRRPGRRPRSASAAVLDYLPDA
jgi:hypothetical protein